MQSVVQIVWPPEWRDEVQWPHGGLWLPASAGGLETFPIPKESLLESSEAVRAGSVDRSRVWADSRPL